MFSSFSNKKIEEDLVEHENLRRVAAILGFIVSVTMLAVPLVLPSVSAQETTTAAAAIPPGTILPVRLNSSISSSKTQPGQIVTARIMQDVPLANGGKVREGSKVIGHVVEVSSPAGAGKQQISLQFDKLISSGRAIPIRTNLRAVAGFMEVIEAGSPAGPVSMPTSTTQVGGDVAYTSGGNVTSMSGEVVGKSVNDGALDQARAGNRQGRECRGVVDSNDSPQAMWVFSSDACGTYGLSEVVVAHAGKTEPVGVIVLVSEKGQFKLPSGSGMLLRVQ